MQIYKEFTTAKNGTQIPVFQSGRTMESRYNPERDAENLCSSITAESYFFLVLGIGSGLFLKLLSQKYPDAKIIALELYDEDISFLLQNENLKNLKQNKNIILCSLPQLENVLLQNYLPAKYGNLKVIEQKAWVNENLDKTEQIKNLLNKTLGIISADYSVQAHFGKIWSSNIINNARLAEKTDSTSLFKTLLDNNKKTAVIAGAGPSLDKTLNIINAENRDNYFIISTDTASLSLVKRNLIPDVIISIDAQSVSYNHFLSKTKKISKTIYAFDLCANASAAKHICQAGSRVLFFCSGHPLAAAINSCASGTLPVFFSGAGTVTITAVDMAVQAGFKELLILGADFSYTDGKAYTSGTYLDTLYNINSSRLSETEKTFSRLMFRTELLSLNKNTKTTAVLEAYRTSLENYLNKNNITFSKENDVYTLHCPSEINFKQNLNSAAKFSLKTFMNKIQKSDINEAETLLLPYVAWLRNNKEFKDLDFKSLLKLALDTIVSYNI